MSDLRQSGIIDFKVQRHGRRDLRGMRPEVWVSLAIALVSSILVILQVYETIDLRSRLISTEMQVKLTEAKAADLATKSRMLSEGLKRANTLIESLQKGPQTPPKSRARKGDRSYELYP